MNSWHLRSASEQVAEHLRGELMRGRWTGTIPGVHVLAAELGIHRKTAEEALRELERQGLLVAQGVGRRRKIEVPGVTPFASLRVGVLTSDIEDRRQEYMLELRRQLEDVGHSVFYPEPHLLSGGMELRRVIRAVESHQAHCWIVAAGSREILEWFAARSVPAFALFGRRRGLPIAGVGPNKPPIVAEATRRLIGLGHRRIVLLARRMRRLPTPGASEQTFLSELEAHGISAGPYHLPDWVESIEGFHARLDSLFQVTPPTALIVQEASLFAAAQQFLGRRRMLVPEDVSLICTDSDPTFAWCRPSVTHIHWPSAPVVQRIVRWAANVSRGRKDVRQTLTDAEFVEGGTIGPARITRSAAV